MKKKLTPKSIDALRPPAKKRYEVRDIGVAGLIVRVSHAGGKVFYVSTRVDGKVKRIRIGPYPVVSLKEARERANSILRDISLGSFESSGAGSSEESVPVLGDVIGTFIERYAKPNNRDWRGTERILKKFSSLNQTSIDQIKRKDISRILDQIIADGAPIRANRALAAIKKLMNWCVDRGELEISPIATMKPPSKENSRERVLTHTELSAVWRACEDEGFPFEQFTKMLILTAQRRGEVAGMRWSEIDLENATWTLPSDRAKNATSHIVPLSSMAIDVLSSVPRFCDSDFVFTTTGHSPVSGFGRLKRRLDIAVGTDAED